MTGCLVADPIKKSTDRESGGTGDTNTMKTSSTLPDLARSCCSFFFAPGEKWPKERRSLRILNGGKEKETIKGRREEREREKESKLRLFPILLTAR